MVRKVAERSRWPIHELGAARRQRRAAGPVPVADRLAALGLQLSPVEGTSGHRRHTHRGTTEDLDALIRDLEATGRFRRDSRLGSLYHRGQISLREVSPSHSLHITARGNEVSAHVDRFSPLADRQPEQGCRYALHRIAAHNVVGMAYDLARLLPRRPTIEQGDDEQEATLGQAWPSDLDRRPPT